MNSIARKTAALASIAAAAGILAACGTSVAKTPAVPPSTSAPAAAIPAAAPSPSSAPLTGPVGTTYTVSGTSTNGAAFSYTVTLNKIDQNAAPDNSFDAPPAGKHLIAAQFTVTGITGSVTNDDSNMDAAMNGTDSQVYTFSVNGVADGTNFNGGDFNLTAGQTEKGWVDFAAPGGVSAASVQWQDGAGAVATWTAGK